jgi:hypothetical protein
MSGIVPCAGFNSERFLRGYEYATEVPLPEF